MKKCSETPPSKISNLGTQNTNFVIQVFTANPREEMLCNTAIHAAKWTQHQARCTSFESGDGGPSDDLGGGEREPERADAGGPSRKQGCADEHEPSPAEFDEELEHEIERELAAPLGGSEVQGPSGFASSRPSVVQVQAHLLEVLAFMSDALL